MMKASQAAVMIQAASVMRSKVSGPAVTEGAPPSSSASSGPSAIPVALAHTNAAYAHTIVTPVILGVPSGRSCAELHLPGRYALAEQYVSEFVLR